MYVTTTREAIAVQRLRACSTRKTKKTLRNNQTAEPEMVFEWRAEAERRMREAGRPGMSEEQVRDFCSRYMPAYRAYLPGLYDSCRRTIDALVVEPEAGDGRRRHRLEGDDAEEAAKETTTNRRDFASGVGGVENTLVIEVGRDRNPVL